MLEELLDMFQPVDENERDGELEEVRHAVRELPKEYRKNYKFLLK